MADIAECAECHREMDVTAAGPFNRVVCPNCQTEIRVKVDLGNYVLKKRLAFGGMSVLFIAEDQTLGRQVALKVLNEDYSSDKTRIAQFEKEAELTALVNHPNVVRVYSVGRAFDRFYIAMELIEGQSLEKRLEDKKGISEKEVLGIALQVAAGLRAAKAAGLIHRDIKPGNILVDGEGTAKIVDFGLSLVALGGRARAQEIFATPYYASPEALTAGMEDFRSDIYALGATLYHTLTGSPPIKASATDTHLLLQAKQRTVALRVAAPHVSRSCSDLVERMMAFAREDRLRSHDEVIASLQRALRGETQPWCQRGERRVEAKAKWNPVPWLGATLVILFGIGAFLWLEVQEDSAVDGGEEDLSSNSHSEVESVEKMGEIERLARQQLENENYAGAEVNFLRFHRRELVSEPTGTWAGIEAALCALLDGRSGDGRAILDLMRGRPREAGLETDARVAMEELLQARPSLSPLELAPSCPAESELALIEFVKILSNWEQGETEALSNLRLFARARFSEQAGWLTPYQASAQAIIKDAQLLADGEPNWEQEWAEGSIAAELNRLEEMAKKIESRGRCQFQLASWQDWLQSERALLAKPTWQE